VVDDAALETAEAGADVGIGEQRAGATEYRIAQIRGGRACIDVAFGGHDLGTAVLRLLEVSGWRR
jgi:hypothetical protein